MAFIGSVSLLAYRTGLAETAPADVATAQIRAAEDSAGAGVEAANRLGGHTGEQLLEAVHSSLTRGTQAAYAVALTIIIGVTVLVLFRLRHVRLAEPDTADAEPAETAGTRARVAAEGSLDAQRSTRDQRLLPERSAKKGRTMTARQTAVT